MSEARKVPVYQQRTPTGVVRAQFAGVEARLADGHAGEADSAVWFLRVATLPGVVPRVGDRCHGADGVWRIVTEVAGRNGDGEWECTLQREDDES